MDLEIGGRWILLVRAAGGQDLVDELVVGDVLLDLLPDPGPIQVRPLPAEELAVHHQHVRPLVGPVLDEGG